MDVVCISSFFLFNKHYLCYYCRKRIQAAQEKRERELREIEDKNLRDKLNKVEAQLKDRKDEIKLEATLKQVKTFTLLHIPT